MKWLIGVVLAVIVAAVAAEFATEGFDRRAHAAIMSKVADVVLGPIDDLPVPSVDAFTQEQQAAISRLNRILLVEVGPGCPRLKIIDSAWQAERKNYGLTGRYLEVGESGKIALNDYNANPSAYCLDIRKSYGPNGTYMRQMVEAK
jgi:hypothetical protein